MSLPPSVAASLEATKVDYGLLGNSGLRVSVPSLDAAYDCGVNDEKWDTANVYSNGDSERVIAQAIKEYNIPRHKLVLMTKAWSCVGEEQFHAYPILDALRKSKDCINQFVRLRTLPGVEDPKSYPTRGQVVLVRAPIVRLNIMRHGKDYETYAIPRPGSNGNVILGEFMQKENGDGSTHSHDNESILKHTEELSSELRRVLYEQLGVVGLQPSREGGALISRDDVVDVVSGQQRVIVHNYGACGTGFQAGYWMATEAIDTLEDLLKTPCAQPLEKIRANL
ncbi:hypothetical protein MPDQ_002689 [Monascus purpureus]|uniref:FAD dependent oxidoreductase domain-containing protein n=1 Tax=Monascus purpureus TaxID=5098 RepID=A0A507QM11_MONPU|nr:hypothetical protein MPDQ_002689 [Monascus purpureus]